MTTATAPPRIDASLALAADRTRLAHERTLMAWIRTAASLISFGFTIYKFFQFEVDKAATPAVNRLIGPAEFSLTMIGIGLAALLLATIQHSREMRTMRATYGLAHRSEAQIVAGLVSVLGLVAMAAVLFRL
jgi:putative membrane protein